MIDLDSLSWTDWIAIYEVLDSDGHLSENGLKELRRIRGK
jgi:hypothetical protein